MSHNSILSEEEIEALLEVTAGTQPRPVVLLVDDDRQVLAKMRHWIERANFHCLTASSAAAAMRRISRDEAGIDLLVTDLRMEHDGSGLDLIRQLKSAGTFLPIIVLSGHAQTRELIEAMELNVLDFMLKPVDPVHFVGALRRCLG